MNQQTINQPKETAMGKILYIFTRTPLHVGAGSAVGAIDLPVQRERHTQFPIIPGSSLKGTFADEWNKTIVKKQDASEKQVIERSEEGKWLFGETDANNASAGALLMGEARLLAFPVRSAKGSFAWITCPLILHRAARDGVLRDEFVPAFPNLGIGEPDKSDELAFFNRSGPLTLDGNTVVLEEYVFQHAGELPNGLGNAFAQLLEDPVWSEIRHRLVILSNGMMSYFAEHACEIAQHVRIDDDTGTVAGTALFNQHNVPSETMFYSVLYFLAGRGQFTSKSAVDAANEFAQKINKPFQFGADASTGLGWCTVKLADPVRQAESSR